MLTQTRIYWIGEDGAKAKLKGFRERGAVECFAESLSLAEPATLSTKQNSSSDKWHFLVIPITG